MTPKSRVAAQKIAFFQENMNPNKTNRCFKTKKKRLPMIKEKRGNVNPKRELLHQEKKIKAFFKININAKMKKFGISTKKEKKMPIIKQEGKCDSKKELLHEKAFFKAENMNAK